MNFSNVDQLELERRFKSNINKEGVECLKEIVNREMERVNNSIHIGDNPNDLYRLQGNAKRLKWILKLLEL